MLEPNLKGVNKGFLADLWLHRRLNVAVSGKITRGCLQNSHF